MITAPFAADTGFQVGGTTLRAEDDEDGARDENASFSTAIPGTTTRLRYCSPWAARTSNSSPSRRSPGTRPWRRPRSTPAGSARWRAPTTCRSTRGAGGRWPAPRSPPRRCTATSGLDGPEFGEPAVPVQQEPAVDYLVRTLMAEGEDITLVPTGPLTNVATALRREPKIAGRTREVVLMGGAYTRGNRTPAAEFNMLADPEAAAIVFDAGWPLTMVGLELTHQAIATSRGDRADPGAGHGREPDGDRAAGLLRGQLPAVGHSRRRRRAAGARSMCRGAGGPAGASWRCGTRSWPWRRAASGPPG